MQVPEKMWIVIVQFKDGKEDCVGGDYATHDEAVEVMNSYWENLSEEERKKHQWIYVDSVTWLHEVE